MRPDILLKGHDIRKIKANYRRERIVSSGLLPF
jgi:hypothetical protein